MKTDTSDRIVAYIKTNHQARVDDLVRVFELSHQAIHKQLKKLVLDGKLKKQGKPPLVFYQLAIGSKAEPLFELHDSIKDIIDKEYLYISPTGELQYGFAGFKSWVSGNHQDNQLVSLAGEYVKTIAQVKAQHSSSGWIEATKKLKDTFSKVFINRLLYGDFYSLPKFGKTKLGQLVLYAKQSQNQKLIMELVQNTRPIIKRLIDEFHIDAVGFIPPTIPRVVQFMAEYAKGLNLALPHIDLVKAAGKDVLVAQKTLSRLEERVTNARNTIFLKKPEVAFKNILLIDDAAGSGATMNETAQKIKTIAQEVKITAFAIVGSFKGFDVIREV